MKLWECSGSALGVLREFHESSESVFRSISHLSGKSCGCMRYSLRNGAYQDAKFGFGGFFGIAGWEDGAGDSHHTFCMVFFFHTFCKRGGKLAPLGTRANRVLRARVSFSLKVESLRDEHPEVRKRLGSFESESNRPCDGQNLDQIT